MVIPRATQTMLRDHAALAAVAKRRRLAKKHGLHRPLDVKSQEVRDLQAAIAEARGFSLVQATTVAEDRVNLERFCRAGLWLPRFGLHAYATRLANQGFVFVYNGQIDKIAAYTPTRDTSDLIEAYFPDGWVFAVADDRTDLHGSQRVRLSNGSNSLLIFYANSPMRGRLQAMCLAASV